jgi:hypothetical protein
MTRSISKPRTKQELMIAVWDDLGRGMVGASELRKIQRSIRDRFGEGAVESPAAIARVLADEGAELRHPEVIELDARWRQSKISRAAKRLGGLEAVAGGNPLRFGQAEALINNLEGLRKESEKAGDKTAAQSAQKIAVEAREIAHSMARDPTLDQTLRSEQAEIGEWLTVWIQTPGLFEEWLELRRRSVDFREKFLDQNKDLPQSHRDAEK